MTAPTVFISYSQDSDEHKDRILALANRLRADGIDAALDQYETSPAEGWLKWMDRHIAEDDFVLVVCTEKYHRRVMGKEEKGKGLGIKWESTLTYQHIYDNDSLNTRFIPILFEDGKTEHIPTPLKGATYYRLPADYEKLYRRLTNQPETVKPELGKLKPLPPRERKSDFSVKVSLAKLPSTSPDLFGRVKELALLDAAWESPQSDSHLAGDCHFPQKINIFSLVAWGGVGKSALVNKWLTQMGRDNYRGAERVFGWSFYSQGAAEGRQVSADQFIAAALTWFGDPDPTAGSPWDKGERLAELVKQTRTLLILDGLEPLQNPPPVETGRIKDPALVSFLREVARQNPGLVVITTRLAVDDLKDFKDGSAKETDLESLSDESGAAYLKHLGVDGTDAERQQASHDFGGHALALTLLGRYLKVVHNGDIRKRGEIPHVMDEQKQGAHARRVMESYEQWLKGKPELDILRLMGLFDRPAEKGALDELREEPAIEGLTNTLQNLSEANWKFALNNLRELRLLAPEDPHEPDTLDCHPLLREHFGEKLKATNPEAWHKGHLRLFIYYATTARPLPRTIEEMAPLYAAVIHGCQAGKYQEAFLDVYWKRIARGSDYFSVRNLGAFGTDLSMLSGFFIFPWRQIIPELHENITAAILNNVGFNLRALSRLDEAAQPMQLVLETMIQHKNWKGAAIYACNLSELYLTIGDVKQALDYAEQSVQFADQSGDAFEQKTNRSRKADVLHQAGRLTDAKTKFDEAEDVQKKVQPEFPLLYSLSGFQYCDLLLSQENFIEVERRASQTMEWNINQPDMPVLTIALDNLSLGRAFFKIWFYEKRVVSEKNPLNYFNSAVDGLRQAGQLQELPRGLLARAEYYRLTGDLVKAQKDVDEAFTIATRGGMGLYLADCHLELARLNVVRLESLNVQTFQPDNLPTEIVEARKHLATAKEMINKMGYHRRDKEVEELEEQLKNL